SSGRRHTTWPRDWSSDVCSSDLRSTARRHRLSLEDCLGAAEECNAPMVSICGGEPLIYPHIEALVKGLLEQARIVYVCTNAMFQIGRASCREREQMAKPAVGSSR